LGAQALPEGGVRFAVWAPNARSVEVLGDWNEWASGTMLQPQGRSGIWAVVCPAATAGQRYKFGVTSAAQAYVLKADPMARQSECPPSNASVVAGADDYVWHDGEWMDGRSHEPGAPLRIYEAHIGSWRSGVDSYVEFGRQLADHVVALGFTHVELLPVAEHPFGGSWGYQVSGYYAPTARYGSPDELRAMVDILHSRGIGVIIDWVPAHFPKDEWSLARFDGTALYEHADPRQGEHPDWGTYVFNYGRNEVRNFLVANALYWLHEFHIDGLRVDAVASMLYLDYSRPAGGWVPNRNGGRENLDAIAFLRELNTVVAEEAPTAMVIAEESTAWPKVTHPISHGGLGFTHKWNMGWMNDTLGYLEHDSVHRRYHHRELSFGLLYAFAERFVLPLSHDEVVHGKGSLLSKMPGDDWQRFANLRALYAWMWAQPGAPLLFMGAEIAPFTEWNESTGLPWHLLDHAPHRGIRDLLAELNRVVASWPALFERDHEPTGFQWLDADDAAHSVYAFLRWGFAGGRAVAAVANFTPVPHSGYRIGLPWAGEWQVLLDTDSPNYGGSGFAGYDLDGLRTGTAVVTATTEVSWQGQPASAVIDLSPLAVLWLGAARP
ncbi:MAG: 1,4-alpha-glucan branching protein GlgB, partial [Ilumatobacteraceae bacterium]|nr:1,4-alpha-glucan branching protein GlgB [Ilumatobacteraceae bacterium]